MNFLKYFTSQQEDSSSEDDDKFYPETLVGNINSPLRTRLERVRLIDGKFSRQMYVGELTSIDGETKEFVIKRSRDSDTLNELEHEAKVLTELRGNAGAVSMTYFQNRAPSYIVMIKFGVHLDHFLRPNNSLKVAIFEEVLSALQAVHDANFVHCDIKPHNILILDNHGVVIAKLCDFESAVQDGELFMHTDAALKYTDQWMCPEVYFGIAGQLRASKAMDIFSLGLIAAVMFDSESSVNKRILPNRDNTELLEQLLRNQAQLNEAMPCTNGFWMRELTHEMCSIMPGKRPTARIAKHRVIGATKLHEQNKQLKTAVSDKLDTVLGNQSIIINRLDIITEHMVSFGADMKKCLQKSTEIQELFDVMMTNEYDCPTLFVCLPVAKKAKWYQFSPYKLVQDRYNIFFICAHTMELVPCGPNMSGFPISCSKPWVVKAAPYIRLGLILLKEVLNTYHIPLPIAQTLNLLGDSSDLQSQFIDFAMSTVSDKFEATANGLNPDELNSDSYLAVNHILRANGYLDNIKDTCGLERVRVGSKVAWIKKDAAVKRDFEQKYQQKQSAIIPPSFTTTKGKSALQPVSTQQSASNAVAPAAKSAPQPDSTEQSASNAVTPSAKSAPQPAVTNQSASNAVLPAAKAEPLPVSTVQSALNAVPPLAKSALQPAVTKQAASNEVSPAAKSAPEPAITKQSAANMSNVASLAVSLFSSWYTEPTDSNKSTPPVWKPMTKLSEIDAHSERISSLAVRSDEHIISVSGGDFAGDKSLRITNPITGESRKVDMTITSTERTTATTKTVPVDFGWAMTVLHNNLIAVTHMSDERVIHIYDSDVTKSRLSLSGHTSQIKCLTALSGNRLASGSWDNTVRIWDCNTGTCLVVLKGHTQDVNSIVALLDNNHIASGSFDNTIRIWDLTTGSCERVLTDHTSFVECLAVLHDGRLVSSSYDKTVRIWNVTTGQCQHVLEHDNSMWSLCVLPNGFLACSEPASDKVLIYNISNSHGSTVPPECVQTLSIRRLECMSCLPDGTLVVGACYGTIELWK